MAEISAAALEEVERALRRYEAEIEASKLRLNAKVTYLRYASMFVRWLKDDFTPGGTLG